MTTTTRVVVQIPVSEKIAGITEIETPMSSENFQMLYEWVEMKMSDHEIFDASHDFDHIKRVLANARKILAVEASRPDAPAYDPLVVNLAALMHDVDDRKYLPKASDGAAIREDVRLSLESAGVPAPLVARIQAVCAGVSYSQEVRHPERAAELLKAHPELAIVQDADRLDAIGAIGIARVFTFGGACAPRGRYRSLGQSIEHFNEKLLRIEGMMKTDEGRRLAKIRTDRLKTFQQWFEDETQPE